MSTNYYCHHSMQDYEIRNGVLVCTECGPLDEAQRAYRAGYEAGRADGYNEAGIDEGYKMAAEPLGPDEAWQQWWSAQKESDER